MWGKIKVLIVEDEAITGASIKQLLEENGYNVVGYARNSAKAIKISKSEKPDIILMDINLNEEDDGITTFGKISEFCNASVIYLTAYSDKDTILRASKTEPYAYILKPYKDTELLTAVKITVQKRIAERKLNHLNRTINAIRNINQLMLREKNIQSLIEKGVDFLKEYCNYLDVRILLFDEELKVSNYAAVDPNSCIKLYIESFMNVEKPKCIQSILNKEEFYQASNILENCSNCPLKDFYNDFGAYTFRLEVDDTLIGVLGITLNSEMMNDEEVSLLKEVSSDIAFGIHNIRKSSINKKLNNELKVERIKYKNLIENSLIGIYTTSESGEIIYANGAFCKILGFENFNQLKGYNIKSFYENPEVRAEIIENIKKQGFAKNINLNFKNKSGENIKVLFNVFVDGENLSGSLMDVTENSKIKKDLEYEKHLLQSLMENIPDTIYFKDKDSKFTRINKAQCEALGLDSPDDAIGKSDSDFFHENFAWETDNDEADILEKGKSVISKIEKLEVDGKPRWVTATKVPIKNSSGEIEGLVGISRDISEIYEKEEQLKKSEEKFRLLAKNSPDIIWEMDEKLNFKYVSPAIKRITGYASEVVEGKNLKDFMPINEYVKMQRVAVLAKNKFKQWKPITYETILINTLNEKISVEITFNVNKLRKEFISFQGTIHDISERVKKREELKAKLDFIEVLLETIPSPICYKNEDLIYIGCNQGFADMVGLSKDEIIGKSVSDVFDADVAKKIISEDEELYMTNGQRVFQKRMKDTSGGERKYIVYKKVYSSENKGRGIVVIYHDISAITKANERLIVLESAIKASVNGIVITDKDGVIEWVNPAFSKSYGYTIDEAIGQNPRIIKSGLHDKTFYKDLWDTILSGEAWRGELINKTKDGNLIQEEMTITPIKQNGEVTKFIAIKNDITDRKVKEQKILKSEEIFHLLHTLSMKSSKNKNEIIEIILEEAERVTESKGAYLHFFNSENESFNLFRWSKNVNKYCDADDNSHYPITQAGIWADTVRLQQPVVHNDYENESDKKGLPEGHFKLIRHLGVPVIEDGKVVAVCGVCNKEDEYNNDDINHLTIIMDEMWKIINKIDIQNRLEKSEEQFRSIFDNTAIGIYRLDSEGKILIANSAFLNMIGYDELADVEGKKLNNLVRLDDNEIEKYEKLLLEEGILFDFENKWKKSDGERIIVSENARMISDNELHLEYIEGTVEDITKEYQAEIKLKESLNLMKKSEEMKTNFLSLMSHEIRTPLNALLSYSRLIRDEFYNIVDDEFRDGFDIIEISSKRIIRTIELILNYSDAISGSFKPIWKNINLQEIYEIVEKNYKKEINAKNLNYSFSCDANEIICKCDSYSVGIIFDNLLDNAIKYTNEGSINVFLNDDGESIKFEIIDTGIGISEEYQKKLFTPFSQEQLGYTRKFEGNGLGLALVKKYTEMNNIDINIVSKKDFGTAVTLIFKKN